MKCTYFLTIILSTISLYICGMELAHEDLVYQLVKNPNSVLQEIKETRKPVENIFDTIKDDLSKRLNISEWDSEFNKVLCNHHIPEHPLLFLDECAGKESDNSLCLLTRKVNPHYRAIFENQVVEALNTMQIQPIEYVDFGTGGGFQTLAGFAKFLTTRKTAALNAHLIDLTYYDTDITAQNELAKHWEYFSKEKKSRTVKEYLFNKKARENLSNFILQAFPLAQISIAHYSTAKFYYDTTQSEPDLIVGADITAPQIYEKLCIAFPAARNIGLIKGCAKSSKSPYAALIEHPKGQAEPIVTQLPSVVFENYTCHIA